MFFHHKLFFILILMTSSLISISSNSWMGMWIGLEMNLLAFIPLMQQKNNSFSIESSLKYFLTQTLASIILISSMILLSKNFIFLKNIENSIMMYFNSALLLKTGMAPFHFWFPEVIDGLNWNNCFILLSWQKLAPMVLIMYNLNFQYFFMMSIIFSLMISGFMGLNQTSLRKLMAYSSINHMSWMISAMFFSQMIWWFYFIIYLIVTFNIISIFYLFNIYFYKQMISSINNNFFMKILFSFNFLSLGGLPPFLGFFPKWLTIQHLILLNWILLSLIMVLLTLMTLFFYMRFIFNILILANNEINYFQMNSNVNLTILMINIFSLFSLIYISLSFNFF
uniref:NADH-ubiquinone oxidoreductase chain 2 n=1 Tax=Staphylinidae sp. BMNH 1274241 TaxID=1796568 RepID=A0A126TEU2_9COLE|nr:NADH dehydrogenase subunit 2 [Staphylinidae sp. BMNH 1274241]